MAQILRFGTAGCRDIPHEQRADLRVARGEQPVGEPDDFWLEVSRGLWVNQPVSVDPANAPGRVLTEILVILGAAGLLVLLATIFFGVPSL